MKYDFTKAECRLVARLWVGNQAIQLDGGGFEMDITEEAGDIIIEECMKIGIRICGKHNAPFTNLGEIYDYVIGLRASK